MTNNVPAAGVAGRRRPRARLAVVAAGCLMGACFSSTTDPMRNGDEPGDLEAALEALRVDWLRAQCEAVAGCFRPLRSSIPTSTLPDLRPGSCRHVDDYFEEAVIDPIRDSIDEGRIHFDPERFDACVEASLARSCSEISVPAEACLQMLEGHVAVGEPCTTSWECEGGGFCDATGCPTRCRAPRTEGEPCSESSQCARGLRCYNPDLPNGGIAEARCLPPAGEGSACMGLQCQDGLICTTFDNTLSCEPLEQNLGPGQPCSATKVCADGMACRGEPPSCTAESVGLPCENDRECTHDESCAGGACTLLPSEGEACESACADRLGCIEGVCKNGRARGEPCSERGDCIAGNCIDGRCAAIGECE